MVARRDRRYCSGDPGGSSSRAAGARIRTSGREPARLDRRPRAGSHKLRSAGGGHIWQIPAGSFTTGSTVFPIHMPAVRDRKEDLPSLIEYLIAHCAARIGKSVKGVDGKSMGRLVDYGWPGNIRELQNFLERAVILREGELANIEDEWINDGGSTASAESSHSSVDLMLDISPKI
jgi:hypothetical protein